MATGSRTLKLSILGDVTNLNKSLKAADNDVGGFAGNLEKFSKRAGQAFAVAGAAAVAYAGKLAIDGVKAAIEDEAAQAKLAKTLENVTGATDATIKATEDYVLQTSLAFGVTDEELRPSLERLVRATKDVEAAQKLQTLALDISAGSGKSLEAVSNALGKAYEGNTGALGKLGVGLGSAELKAMSLNEITTTLSETFGGQATDKANTFQGKMDKLKVAFDEAKESVGAALLPIITRMAEYINTNMVPALNSFIDGLTGRDSLNQSLTNTQETALLWGKRIRGIIETIISFKDELILLGKVLATVFVVSAVAGWVTATINGIKTLIIAYNALKASAIVAGIASAFALNPLLGVGAVALAAGVLSAGFALANKFSTQVPGSSDLTGMESTGLSAGLYGSTPEVKKRILSETSTVFPPPTDPTKPPRTAAQIAIDEANEKTLADIAKLEKEVAEKQKKANEALVLAEIKLAKLNPISDADLNFQDTFRSNPMNTVYNVTVNGAIDPIGTARAISDVLGSEATTSGTFNNLGFSRLVAS